MCLCYNRSPSSCQVVFIVGLFIMRGAVTIYLDMLRASYEELPLVGAILHGVRARQALRKHKRGLTETRTIKRELFDARPTFSLPPPPSTHGFDFPPRFFFFCVISKRAPLGGALYAGLRGVPFSGRRRRSGGEIWGWVKTQGTRETGGVPTFSLLWVRRFKSARDRAFET